jgi:hypothetical protein
MSLYVIPGGAGPTNGLASMLVLELVQRLDALKEWEPVGATLESARGALAGHDGISAKEVERMQQWAGRWEKLRPDLQMFYIAHVCEHEIAHYALLSVLHGSKPVTGKQYAELKQLWVDHFAMDPPFDIQPTRRP